MKTSNLFAYLFLFVLVIASCNKDDNNSSGPSGSMSATIDGVNWVSSDSGSQYNVNDMGLLYVTGVNLSGGLITITLRDTTEQEYSLDELSGGGASYSTDHLGTETLWASHAGFGGGGKATLTDYDYKNKIISGTFEFRAWRFTDSSFVNVTNGKFKNIPLVREDLEPTTSTMSVKLDGKDVEIISVFPISNFGRIAINGSSKVNGEAVGITVDDDITPGTYELEDLSLSPFVQYIKNQSTFFNSYEGKVIITKHELGSIIEGTFFCTAKDALGNLPDVTLTEGSFSVEL